MRRLFRYYVESLAPHDRKVQSFCHLLPTSPLNPFLKILFFFFGVDYFGVCCSCELCFEIFGIWVLGFEPFDSLSLSLSLHWVCFHLLSLSFLFNPSWFVRKTLLCWLSPETTTTSGFLISKNLCFFSPPNWIP